MFRIVLSKVQDFFGLTARETRGATVLILLSTIALFFPIVFKRTLPYWAGSPELVLTPELKDSIRALLASGTQRNSTNEIAISPVPFDPNSASLETLKSNGISQPLAQRIINYRSKGGSFKSPADLKKIYGFSDSLYHQVASYVQIVSDFTNKTSVANERSAKTTNQKIIVPFDINTADTTALIQLRGIGNKRALTIIKFRDALGGFHNSIQYKEIFGLDSTSLQELRRYARILSPPKKIAINEITLEDLLKHPYARKNRKLAQAIIHYRTQNGNFTTSEDLYNIRNMDSEYLQQLKPYLDF